MTYMHRKSLTNHRKLPDGRMVLFDTTSGKYYDPVTDTFLDPDEVVKYGLMEKAPPSSKAEDWIKNNKENFKKQYGKKWEQVLYATAWKKFGGVNKQNVYENKYEEQFYKIKIEVLNELKKMPLVVFGSLVNKSLREAGDFDVFLDLDKNPEHKKYVAPLLKLAKKYYGWIDNFVLKDGILFVRNDYASGYQKAKNTKSIIRDIKKYGISIADVKSEKLEEKKFNESVVKNMPEVKNLRKKGFSVYVSRINHNDTLYEIEKDNKEMTVIYHKNDEKFHIYDNSRSRYKHSSLEDAVKREFPQDIKEHKNPEYINKWKDEGFNIGIMHDDSGITFVVSKDNVDIEIHEPETGTYETDGKSFNSFDDAMSYQIKSSFTDINVNENNTNDFRLLLNRLNLTEKFSFFATKEDKEVLKKAYELGSKSNDGTILKGRSPIDDEMFELIISHPDIRKKLIVYFTKGFNG